MPCCLICIAVHLFSEIRGQGQKITSCLHFSMVFLPLSKFQLATRNLRSSLHCQCGRIATKHNFVDLGSILVLAFNELTLSRHDQALSLASRRTKPRGAASLPPLRLTSWRQRSSSEGCDTRTSTRSAGQVRRDDGGAGLGWGAVHLVLARRWRGRRAALTAERPGCRRSGGSRPPKHVAGPGGRDDHSPIFVIFSDGQYYGIVGA